MNEKSMAISTHVAALARLLQDEPEWIVEGTLADLRTLVGWARSGQATFVEREPEWPGPGPRWPSRWRGPRWPWISRR